MLNFLPAPTHLRGHDIAVGDVILNVWPDVIEAFLVDEITMEPDPVTVHVTGRKRLNYADGAFGQRDDARLIFGKDAYIPVASTFFDCTGDWSLS